MLYVIEHLEPRLSRWVLIEYEHASMIVGRDNLAFTNVKRGARKLQRFGVVYKESAVDLFDDEGTIILDPRASELLEPSDFKQTNTIIVGGILGDHPPRGRTYKLITSRMKKAKAKSLGDGQFSIDGSIYMALKVSQGFRLEDIPIARGLTLKCGSLEIHLPFCYPLINGKPVVSPKLLDYLLEKDIIEDGSRS
ncbi:MAG: SAM-dependent methyltransferase [Nitrososphaerota archaeon]|nr:SAM-dependent methyltransferase [Nitrososphaerota archaeon]